MQSARTISRALEKAEAEQERAREQERRRKEQTFVHLQRATIFSSPLSTSPAAFFHFQLYTGGANKITRDSPLPQRSRAWTAEETVSFTTASRERWHGPRETAPLYYLPPLPFQLPTRVSSKIYLLGDSQTIAVKPLSYVCIRIYVYDIYFHFTGRWPKW